MLKVERPTARGFDTVVMNERFKCAFITHSPYYSFGEVDHLKRHRNTDEVFVLLSGHGLMLILEDDKFTEHPMEQGCAYNVKKGTWHYLAVSEDAQLFVAEGSDTDDSNTDVWRLDEPYILK